LPFVILGSNIIENEGGKAIGKALETNTGLVYLNLCIKTIIIYHFSEKFY
jgi:hypothetical protein